MASKAKINARWFQDRLADKQISQRGFAKMVGMDPAALTYAIHGKRAWKHDELVAFATITGVPFEEAVANAGLSLPTLDGKGMVSVAGTVDALGNVTLGKVEAPRRVPTPPESPSGTVALRFRTPTSAAELMDGWLAYFVEGVKRVPPEAVGKLCVTWLAGGRVLLAIVRRGYARGTFNVQGWTPGGELLEAAVVERAAPVLWIRCGV